MPAPSGAYVQTWLFDPKTNEMIAIGVMDQDSASFPIPASVDLDTYTSVDISLEPLDGNPAHSATSLARGELTPAVRSERSERLETTVGNRGVRQSETTTTEAAVPRTGTSVPTPGTCSGRSIGVTTRTTTVFAVVATE